MSLLAFPGGFVCPYLPDFSGTVAAFVNSALNDGTDRVSFVFMAPKTGTLDWFEYRQGVNTTPPTNGIRFAIQALTGNDPSGTDLVWRDVTSGFGAGVWLVPPGVMTNTGAGGGTQLALTKGVQYAAVMYLPSFVAGNVSMSYLDLNSALQGLTNIQYGNVFAAAWARNFNTGCIALKYSSGYEIVAPNVFPIKTLTQTNFNNGSTPDEIALRFQLTTNAYIGGCIFRCSVTNGAEVNLYSGTTVIAGPFTVGPGVSTGVNVGYAYVPIDTTLLTANTPYRIALKPTSASSITYQSFAVDSAGLMAATPGGAEWYLSTRTDAGAWSDTTTARPWAGILLEGVDSIPLGAEVAFPMMG